MTWSDVGDIIGKAAPAVGMAIGGPAGAAVGTLVSKALGCKNTPDDVANTLNANPEQILKLKELENAKEFMELNAQIQNEQLAYGDTASARDMNIKTNESQYGTWLAKNSSSINGLVIMLAFFAFAVLGVFDFGIPVREKEFDFVFQAVYGLATLYAGYLYGSSKVQKDIALVK